MNIKQIWLIATEISTRAPVLERKSEVEHSLKVPVLRRSGIMDFLFLQGRTSGKLMSSSFCLGDSLMSIVYSTNSDLGYVETLLLASCVLPLYRYDASRPLLCYLFYTFEKWLN